MEDALFRGWDNFYLVIGSAAAGLIGLLFVVTTLTAGLERSKALRGVGIYMTPNAVHFSVVLTASAVAMVPRLPIPAIAAVLGASALAGLANAVWACIGIRMGLPDSEPPHWSDFWIYGVVPAVLYLVLGAAAVALLVRTDWAIYAVATVLLALLLVGIRNAWDLVTWMATLKRDAA